jgi:hypothetical protein
MLGFSQEKGHKLNPSWERVSVQFRTIYTLSLKISWLKESLSWSDTYTPVEMGPSSNGQGKNQRKVKQRKTLEQQ